MYPRYRTGLSAFVVSDEPSVTHQPAKGPLNDPSPRQDGEASDLIRAFNDFNLNLRPMILYPLLEGLARIAPVSPNFSQPGKPVRHLSEQSFGSFSVRAVGGRSDRSNQQTQAIDQDVTLAPFDLLAGIVANLASVPVRFDALAVEDGGGGFVSPSLVSADTDSQDIIKCGPSVVERPSPEDVVNRLPRRKINGQLAPLDPSLEDIEDSIDDDSSIGARSSEFIGFADHRFEELPLAVGQIGVVSRIFHRPNGGCAEKLEKSSNYSRQCYLLDHSHYSQLVQIMILFGRSRNGLFQTGSNHALEATAYRAALGLLVRSGLFRLPMRLTFQGCASALIR